MDTILIAGGTGLIGKRLSTLLQLKGQKVIHLSRSRNLNAEFPAYQWDVQNGTIELDAVTQADYIINLAGAGIADKPWTQNRKQVIIDSRTQSTRLLLSSLQKTGHRVKKFISAAAIGYYGDQGEKLLSESANPGKGFLSESCIAWEAAIQEVADAGIPTGAIRIGVVLSTADGALPKMMMTLPLGIAPYFGNGQQWYSWIHMEDLCRLFIHLLEQEDLKGTFNGVAPNPVRNKEFMRSILKAKGQKALLLPAPSFALKVAMGEMAAVVLYSTRVSAQKVLDSGFEFSYPQLEGALQALFSA